MGGSDVVVRQGFQRTNVLAAAMRPATLQGIARRQRASGRGAPMVTGAASGIPAPSAVISIGEPPISSTSSPRLVLPS